MNHPIHGIEHELTLIVKNLNTLTRHCQYPMDRAHYILLSTLKNKEAVPIGDLAQELLLDKSTITRQIEAMENKKLVERIRSPKDARSVLVSATHHGKTLVDSMYQLRIDLLKNMLSDWSHEELRQLENIATKLNSNIHQQIHQLTATPSTITPTT